MQAPRTRARTWLISVTAAVAVALGIAGIANAAANGSSSNSSSASNAASASSSAVNPRNLTHGPGETLLTGTTAAQVRAAALAAVPGGTIIRVETDSAGSPYEAHVTKSDGTQVTVKVDKNFKVTKTEAGFGSHNGRGLPNGQPPASGGTA